ncbi:MAG: nucleotide excision repair endonuclease [candidate division KSB1 bacterium]|nr:nucleotide excision repair endonuclease [candidate division KSB1 bacterium]
MKEKLYAYLTHRQSAVSSVQLVRDVLRIQGATAQLADTLIASAVEGDPRFERTTTGWKVAGYALDQVRFTVLQQSKEPSRIAFALVERMRLQNKGVVEILPSPMSARVTWDRPLLGDLEETDPLAYLVNVVQGGCVVEFKGAAGLRMLNSLSVREGVGEIECDHLSLQGLALGELGVRYASPEALAKGLRVSVHLDERGVVPVDLLAELLLVLLERCRNKGLSTLEEILQLAEPPAPPATWARLRFGPDFLRQVPQLPGAYLMVSQMGEVLYVGKARNLRQRLRSYFQPTHAEETKVALLHRHLYDIRIEPVGSELEALLLEHRLIRQYDPPVNRQVAVHPRTVRSSTRSNCIVVMPSVAPGAVELFLASRSGLFRQMRVVPPVPEQHVQALLAEIYFAAQAPQPKELELELSEIMFSWLEQHRDSVSWIEVDGTAGLHDCLRLVRLHVERFEPGIRQIFR